MKCDLMSNGNEDKPRGRRQLVLAANCGLTIAVGILLFGAVGYWIDRKRGGGVLFSIGGLLLGLVAGGFELWKWVRKLNEP